MTGNTICFILLLVGLVVVTFGCGWFSRDRNRSHPFSAIIFMLYVFCILLPGVIYLKYGTLDGSRIEMMETREKIAKVCHNNGNSVCW